MRVATWNINGLRARLDFARLWLAEREPDVVALQELKIEDASLPPDAFPGYQVAAHCQRGWNGVAVLTREPITATVAGLPGAEELGARLVAAQTDRLTALSAYIPNGKYVGHPDFQSKLDWLDALGAHIAAMYRPDEPLLLCGDFNLVPAALDSWDEERLRGAIFHTDAERSRFAGLLRWGFHDLFRERHPAVQKFSWWDYRAGAFHKNQGLRIDFVLGTKVVRDAVREVEIDRDYRKKHDGLIPSDHAPVYVDVDL